MLNFIKQFFRKQYLPEWTVVLCWLIIVATTYVPGTWLLGWDSLVPEFNFPLNVSRSISGVWQEYQGLGLTGGMAHTADLPRQLVLWAVSPLLPDSLLRFGWTAAMLLLGPLGAIRLSRLWLRLAAQPGLYRYSDAAGLVAGLFYLCNIATVQNFYVPYEAFSSFYGFLPWFIIGLVVHLEKPSRSTALGLAIVFTLGASAFYVQTLFVVLAFFFACLIIFYTWQKRQRALYPVISAGLVILAVSLFWMIPVAYFTVTNVDVTATSLQNSIATPETQAFNRYTGTIANILQLKGFWFEYTDMVDGKTVYLFDSWRSYYGRWPVLNLIQVVLSGFALFGLLQAFRRKHYLTTGLWIGAALSLVMLSAGNGLLGIFYTLLTNVVPLLGQMFRTSFTKWSILYALLLSIGLSGWVAWLSNTVSNYRKTLPEALTHRVLTTVVVLLILLPVLPIFAGKMIYRPMQVRLPEEYLDLFSFFETQPQSARILTLPADSFWGWQFTDWKYRGSGFLWYGIRQPIVDRNFDVWSAANETLYLELSHALRSGRLNDLKTVLEKYQLKYVLIDRSQQQLADTAVRLAMQEELLSEVGAVLAWQKGDLSVYLLPWVPANHLVSLQQPISAEAPFAEVAHYQQPALQQGSTNFTLTAQLPALQADVVQLPAFEQGEAVLLRSRISYVNDRVQFDFDPTIATLLINGVPHFLQQPEATSIILEKTFDQVFLDIQGTPATLKQGEIQTVEFVGEMGAPLRIQYVDSLQTRQGADGQFVVDTDEVYSAYVNMSFLNPLLEEREISVENGIHSLAFSFQPQSIDLLSDWTKSDSIHNCDSMTRGTVEKQINRQENTITYTSKRQGIACEGYDISKYPSLPHILTYSGKNDQGRNIKLIASEASNPSFRVEIIPKESEFAGTLILPEIDTAFASPIEPTYRLHLETRSLAQEVSSQTMYHISEFIVPVPFSYLQRITTNSTSNSAHSSDYLSNDVATAKKFGTGYYAAAITDNGKTIAVSQAFDPGWIAFPSLRPWRAFEHVKYNGWANAWIIPPADTSSGNSSDKAAAEDRTMHITILYWPQLLTFAGYAVLIVTLGWLGRSAWIEHQESKKLQARARVVIERITLSLKNRLRS